MSRAEVYLRHIRDAIHRILSYTEGGEDEFFANPMIQDAVVRNLEIIGEAVKNLPSEVRDAEPGIPWKQMSGMRDKLIHEYFGVDLKMVWAVVDGELPRLQKDFKKLLDRV